MKNGETACTGGLTETYNPLGPENGSKSPGLV
jgi:hypothetical protein